MAKDAHLWGRFKDQMDRAQIEAMLDKLAADNAVVIATASSAGPNHTQRVLAIVIIQALEIAIEKVLEVLMEQHSGTFGPWFNEVETAAIKDAKQVFSSGLSDDERAVATKGVEAVEEVFSDFRKKMQRSQSASV